MTIVNSYNRLKVIYLSEGDGVVNKVDFTVDYYFIDAMEHYIKFRAHYYDSQLETNRPVTPNELSVNMLRDIIEHLSEKEVSYDAVFQKCLRSAKKRLEIITLEGLFYCKKCEVKARIPIDVKTTTDHIELTKNGSLDIEAFVEMQNTEETFTLELLVTDNLLSECTCEEKENSFYANTSICVHLSDETVEYLIESVDKKEAKRLSLHK